MIGGLRVASFLLLASASSVAGSGLSFLAIGDWGGSPVPPYTLPGQVAAAKGMGTVAAEIESSFTLALGDNFYFSGVTDVDSSRFAATWDKVYSSSSLQKPWYVIAGNHDHNGNVSAQILFTKEDPSNRWTFPSPYHAHSFKGTDGVTVDIILIDTVDLCSMNSVQEEGAEGYFAALPTRLRSDASAQWTWIESQLSSSKADFILVGGHYPVFSVCEHGPTQTLIDHLEPLLVKYGAHYMSGHDHCFNHFVVGAEKTNYILTGLGDECCYDDSNLDNKANPSNSLVYYASKQNKPSGLIGGFTSFVVSAAAGMQIQHHDQTGKVLFKAAPVAPRAH